MRMILILSRVALLAGFIGLGADDGPVAPKRAATTAAPPSPTAPQPGAKPAESLLVPQIPERAPAAPAVDPAILKPTVSPETAEQRSADEAAIRQVDLVFQAAYEKRDAQAAAACFTPDAEFVDEQGNVVQGRAAIEESLTEFFAAHPDCTLEMNVDSIRFVSPGVAVEDGSTKVTHQESSISVDCRYTAVYVKTDGKWFTASVRDHAPKGRREHRAQLEQLAWLIGDWVDEGDDSLVNFSCQSVENGNFLLRQFNIQVAGQEVMSGTQRIGWDPLTGKLRAWIFDSEGAYGEGLWHRDGENWVLKTTGVLANGQTASSTSIYTFVNEHTMTWQSVDHEIAGVQQLDSEVFTIVRQAPAPAALTTTETE